MILFYTSLVHIFWDKLCQTSAEDNELNLMMKHAPEWLRTRDHVLIGQVCYPWTTGYIYFTRCILSHSVYEMGSLGNRMLWCCFTLSVIVPNGTKSSISHLLSPVIFSDIHSRRTAKYEQCRFVWADLPNDDQQGWTQCSVTYSCATWLLIWHFDTAKR